MKWGRVTFSEWGMNSALLRIRSRELRPSAGYSFRDGVCLKVSPPLGTPPWPTAIP